MNCNGSKDLEEIADELSKRHHYDKEIVARWIDRYGFKRAEAILKSLKNPTKWKFYRVNRLKGYPWKVLEFFIRENWEAEVHSILEDLVFVTVKGPFKIEKEERCKAVFADKFAAESVFVGSDLFSPGVLKADKVRKNDEVIVMNKHCFLVAKGVAEVDGKEMIIKPPIERKGIAVRTLFSIYNSPSIRNTHLYKEGIVYAQSLPAALAVYNLSPEKGEVIVDLCAAPGGKTTHATELTGGNCRVIAVEKKPRRMKKLKENLERMGLNNLVTTYLEDARNFPQKFNVKADKVIVDPPCTGFGIRPSLYKETTLRDVEGLSTYSRQLIRAGSKLLKKGGRLLYSTCTLEPEENELVVDYAVKELGLKLEEQPLFFGVEGESLESIDFNPSLVQRFYPDIHPYPGFFIAVFKH